MSEDKRIEEIKHVFKEFEEKINSLFERLNKFSDQLTELRIKVYDKPCLYSHDYKIHCGSSTRRSQFSPTFNYGQYVPSHDGINSRRKKLKKSIY